MKKKLLFLVTVLAFMVAMPIASAEVLEAKDATTLVEMFKKAKNGDTVKLTADITDYDQKLEINSKRTITLDMNGHNITYLTGSESFIGVYGATLIVKGSGVITNDTDSGLNVYGKETKDDSFVSKLIVEKDVTLKGKYGLAIFYDNDKGSHGVTVDFYGKVDVTDNGIATNGDILNEDGPVVNIKKGAVVKSTGTDGAAVYCAGNGTYNIEDGTTITGATGIEVRAGKLINLYEINVLNGDGRVEKLEDGKFTIAIAIPESEQKYDAYKVVYFDEEGKLVETLDAKLENGKVVFTTTHLSTYGVVGYNNVATKNPATNDMNLALILASLGLASAGAVLVSRKKLAKANR